MKDEKILKKLDKLLKMYGVEDEEKRKLFLNDVQDAKYDEEEVIKENDEENLPNNVEEPTKEVEETTQTEETEVGEEQKEETTEEVKENTEEEPTPNEETTTEEETKTDDVPNEEVVKVDEKLEEHQEQPTQANEQVEDEIKKALDGVCARVKTLEELFAKLGTPMDDVGLSPNPTAKEDGGNDAFNEFIRKRIG